MDYKVFTSNLSNLKAYKKNRDELEEELEVLLYEMTGVKGVSFDHVPMSFNPEFASLKKLDLIDKYDDKLREFNFICMAIEETERILAKMPDRLREMLTDAYIRHMSFQRLGMKHGYTDGGMWAYLQRETERYL